MFRSMTGCRRSTPLRPIRETVDEILRGMAKEFDAMYAKTGRPSVPPERLLRAVLLQIFYSVRSERLLREQLAYNLLFRWFVGLEMDEPVWNHAVFSKNRERLLNQEVAQKFFQRVLTQAKSHLSDEHFTVDGTLAGLPCQPLLATRFPPVMAGCLSSFSKTGSSLLTFLIIA